jgi:hypothetical protein
MKRYIDVESQTILWEERVPWSSVNEELGLAPELGQGWRTATHVTRFGGMKTTATPKFHRQTLSVRIVGLCPSNPMNW